MSDDKRPITSEEADARGLEDTELDRDRDVDTDRDGDDEEE